MHEELLSILTEDASIKDLARGVRAGGRLVASGSAGSSTSLVAGALARSVGRVVVLVVAHLDDAEECVDELTGLGVGAMRFPAIEALPGETGASAELFAERLLCARAAPGLSGAFVVVAPIAALMQLVPAPSRLESLARELRAGQRVNLTDLVHWLGEAGYDRVESIEEPGQFALRGGILDVFPPSAGRSGEGVPARIDFFGDEIERLREIDLDTMGCDRSIDTLLITAATRDPEPIAQGVSFLDLLPGDSVPVIAETMEVVEQGRGYFERVIDDKGIVGPPAVLARLAKFDAMVEVNQFSASRPGAGGVELPIETLASFDPDVNAAMGELAALGAGGTRVMVCCQNAGEASRFGELLEGIDATARANIARVDLYLHRGFVWRGSVGVGAGAVAFVPYHELINRFAVRRRMGRVRSARAMDTFLDIAPGDYVVHAEHGIARFDALKLMTPREIPGATRAAAGDQDQEEYLVLEFAGKSRLYVPAVQIDKVQKYVGGHGGRPPLSTLGGQKWKRQKERVVESVRDLAAELLRVRAAREHMPGVAFPVDTPWQREFEDEFPYEETEDQLAALSEIKKDMQAARPMDRLICGDVGFGKTELAIRASFKACEAGRQTAVLVPTTLLAEQHERTFRARFAGYPFRVESLSRFKSGREAVDILRDLRQGKVDVVIGTHRILSEDVRFKDLGLVVVDEEQRFGVEHKERLLRLRLTVDVLTLSATPIPRTLHLALLGLRDIASLTTAPLDRRAIVTEVIPFNERRLQQVIARELAREGQVFYVHNRVHDIRSVADDVRKLAPGARIVVGHGQMTPGELEEVMLAFIRREADILVSTTIIESGIDIPSANTMIIDNADRFGLAELHQLRGRVGRSKHRGYCYLLLPEDRAVKETARKRLKAIEQYSMLGAGFKIAMRDLEIRGAGNILGAEQSGHIAAVGYEMYCRLLEGSVRELRQEPAPAVSSALSIEIGVGGLIPRAYIASDQRRLEAYRRLATASDAAQLEAARVDLVGAYGVPPKPTLRLLELAQIRVVAGSLGVRTITIRDKDVVFITPRGDDLARVLNANAPSSGGSVRVLPPKHAGGDMEVYLRPGGKDMLPRTVLAILRRRLGLTPLARVDAAGPSSR